MERTENVVVVVVDALRADRVGVLDGEKDLTPNIDALAEEGTVFENAFACSSNTDPSVTSLLTGRYPLQSICHHGKLVTEREKQTIESVTPLPEILSESGWQTVAVGQAMGRWHSRGFDKYPETDTQARLQSQLFERARDVFDVVKALSPTIGSTIRRLYNRSNREMKPATVMQDYDPTDLLSRIESTPFFGFVHLMETHMPYLGTTEDFAELKDRHDYPGGSVAEFFEDREVTQEQRERVVDTLDSLGLDRPGEILALYDASVRYADRKVGALVDALREHGVWDETTLFITADHGESLLEHGIYLDHHGLYDDVFRVPLISSAGDGRRCEELVQLIDIAPTVLDLLDAPAPPMDGESLSPLLTGTEGWDGRPAAFAEEAYTERRVGVRTDKWKYIKHVPDEAIEEERGSSLVCGYCDTVHGSEKQLFDLKADPDEQTNVVSKHPDVVDELEDHYDQFTAGLVEPDRGNREVQYEHEDEVLDRLEAIGYR